MYELYCGKHQKETEPIRFNDYKEAEMYAQLLYHFGQEFWLVNGIYEYDVVNNCWDNMAY